MFKGSGGGWRSSSKLSRLAGSSLLDGAHGGGSCSPIYINEGVGGFGGGGSGCVAGGGGGGHSGKVHI